MMMIQATHANTANAGIERKDATGKVGANAPNIAPGTTVTTPEKVKAEYTPSKDFAKVSISEQAQASITKEAEALPFIRKVQAMKDITTESPGFQSLKAQLSTPEGRADYLANLNTDAVAAALIQQSNLKF